MRFYSQKDEDMLFAWIKQIQCIERTDGVGRVLQLSIASKNISDEDLLDLMGLFSRYGFEQEQLKVFMTKENAHWFD